MIRPARTHEFEFDVLHPDDHRETVVVAAPRVLVGSGIHCDVRIGDVWSPREQILFEAIGDEVVAHARAQDALPLAEGRPFVHLHVGPDTVISAAGARLRVRAVPRRAPAVERLARAVTVGVLLAAILCAPGLAWLALARPPARLTASPAAVSLWDASAPECRIDGVNPALAFATRLRALAGEQRERAPFAVAEGPQAVRSFESAAACFRRADQPADAEKMQTAAATLRAQVEEDYRLHRLRLDHAIETRDDAAIAHELDVLEALTAGRSGPYVDWLRSVDRALGPRFREAGQLATKEPSG